MANYKIPKSIKLGLKVFGIWFGLTTMLNCSHASIKGNLPVSTVSEQFPTSYQTYIDKLKAVYPNASFKAVYTGLDWNTVVKHESYEVSKKISTIPSSFSSVWKMNGENTYIDGYFVAASKGAVAYVLDPRNSLYEREIFQFEGLSYNENITPQVIEKVIVSSPMVGTYAKKYKKAGAWVDMDMSYAETIDKVGKEQGVSSVYIASRMIQETSGDIVNNGSINGSNSTYPGVYNFFNIGSTPNSDGSGSVLNGLKHAKSQGWTTPYLAISGGVNQIKSSYIKYGQDTVYFQKFDVNNPYGNATALMAYQYQTNIMAPISESRISYKAYQKLDMLDTAFTFYIPVYNNMPEDPTPYPSGDSAKFVEDKTKAYLDDEISNGTDTFNIRSSASSELDNIIYTLNETVEGADNRTILTRTKKGDGYDWDYVELSVDGKNIKGYIWNQYVKEYSYIKVEGLTLDKTEHTIEQGQSFELLTTVTPLDAKFKDVTWKIEDENIVSLKDGKFTALIPGETTITATTFDDKTASCKVTVIEKTQDITLDKSEYSIEIDEKIQPIVTLKNIENYELKIVDETIASITEGKICGIKAGETILEVKGIGTDIVKTAKIIVNPKVYEITLDKEEYKLEEGEALAPVITSKNIESYELKIVDETIASITEGKICGIKAGETILEVKGIGTDIVKTAKIIVNPKVYEITLDKEEYKLEEGEALVPSITLKNIESYELKILDETIANITEGKICGIKAGETILEVKGVGTDIVKRVKVIVNAKKQVEYKFQDSLSLSSEKIVTKIEPNTSVNVLKEKIQLTNLTLIINDINGKELLEQDVVGTGTTLTFLNQDSTEYDKITIVICGEVTGDGLINSADLLKTVKYLKQTTDINIQAADVTKDGVINSADLLKTVKYLKGTSTIDFN